MLHATELGDARIPQGCNAHDNHLQYLAVNYGDCFESAQAFDTDDDGDDNDDLSWLTVRRSL